MNSVILHLITLFLVVFNQNEACEIVLEEKDLMPSQNSLSPISTKTVPSTDVCMQACCNLDDCTFFVHVDVDADNCFLFHKNVDEIGDIEFKPIQDGYLGVVDKKQTSTVSEVMPTTDGDSTDPDEAEEEEPDDGDDIVERSELETTEEDISDTTTTLLPTTDTTESIDVEQSTLDDNKTIVAEPVSSTVGDDDLSKTTPVQSNVTITGDAELTTSENETEETTTTVPTTTTSVFIQTGPLKAPEDDNESKDELEFNKDHNIETTTGEDTEETSTSTDGTPTDEEAVIEEAQPQVDEDLETTTEADGENTSEPAEVVPEASGEVENKEEPLYNAENQQQQGEKKGSEDSIDTTTILLMVVGAAVVALMVGLFVVKFKGVLRRRQYRRVLEDMKFDE